MTFDYSYGVPGSAAVGSFEPDRDLTGLTVYAAPSWWDHPVLAERASDVFAHYGRRGGEGVICAQLRPPGTPPLDFTGDPDGSMQRWIAEGRFPWPGIEDGVNPFDDDVEARIDAETIEQSRTPDPVGKQLRLAGEQQHLVGQRARHLVTAVRMMVPPDVPVRFVVGERHEPTRRWMNAVLGEAVAASNGVRVPQSMATLIDAGRVGHFLAGSVPEDARADFEHLVAATRGPARDAGHATVHQPNQVGIGPVPAPPPPTMSGHTASDTRFLGGLRDRKFGPLRPGGISGN